MSTAKITETLRKTLSSRPPYLSGTCSIPGDEFKLYYDIGDDAHIIDLSKATSAQLQTLTEACQPATFGVNQLDVMDESYRKAGKMDVSNFASKFTIDQSGIIDHVRDELVEGTGQIRVELYKLNVYGKDSFFKAHKDTPRGADMFGSLVIVFPCEHVGGALLLRHEGKEWSFDAASELAKCTEPSIGYVAFYSDVEHEVALVTSGYRVTLTYNLYHAAAIPRPSRAIRQSAGENETALMAGLLDLLQEPTILPKGGVLGFGLQHEYPVGKATTHVNLIGQLKGADALAKRVCEYLLLKPLLMFTYSDQCDDDLSILSPLYIDLSINDQVEDVVGDLIGSGGFSVRDPLAKRAYGDEDDESGRRRGKNPPLDIYWVNKPTDKTSIKGLYVAYGNEASLDHYYAKVSLIVFVGPVGRRGLVDRKP
ncbi:hypothetical protein HWV62_2589 [Athelia sp. TMB]|nr:hypothetical protein HWV62_2589 [Athelia sp. TMB]